MTEPVFLSLDEILFIHTEEIKISGGEPNIRDLEGVKACVDAPKASFGGKYLQNLYEMAASYLACIVMRHPFVDGNKRTALGSASTDVFIHQWIFCTCII